MKTKSILVIALLLIAAACFAQYGGGQGGGQGMGGPGMGMGRGMGMGMGMMAADWLAGNANQLNLSDEQKTKIQQIKQKFIEDSSTLTRGPESRVKRQQLLNKATNAVTALLTNQQKVQIINLALNEHIFRTPRYGMGGPGMGGPGMGGPGMGGPGMGGPGMGGPGMGMGPGMGLLTPEQMPLVMDIRMGAMQKIRAINMDSNLSTEEKQAQISKIRSDAAAKISEILTPEQKKQMEDEGITPRALLGMRGPGMGGPGMGGPGMGGPGMGEMQPGGEY